MSTMKAVTAILAPATLLLAFSAASYKLDRGGKMQMLTNTVGSPVDKVLTFLEDLKSEIETDSQAEAASYTAFEAWYNSTVNQTTADVAANERAIEAANAEIEQLSGSLATALAEIKYAKEQIAANEAAQKEATNIRAKEAKDFKKSEEDLEDSIASLKQAAEELGAGSAAFLAISSQPPLDVQRVSRSIKDALQKTAFISKLTEDKLQLLQSFTSSPPRAGLVQASGPSATYSSQTSEVANVIVQNKEDFEADLAESRSEETSKQKAFNKLMTTISSELSDLKKGLATEETNNAGALKDLSDNKLLRSDTQVELKANQKLLKETLLKGKVKREQFLVRSKLRSDELSGISQALDILSSGDANQTFQKSNAVNLLQLSAVAPSDSNHESRRQRAYESLQAISSQYKITSLAQVAVQLKKGSQFNKIISRIDAQITHLRAEEKEDVEHRDECQKQLAQNENDLATLENTIQKKGTKIARLRDKQAELQGKASQLGMEMNDTQAEIAERAALRDQEHEEFLTALSHDKEALQLLEDATASIQQFYKQNNIDISLATIERHQKSFRRDSIIEVPAAKPAAPAPDAGFQDAKYQGAKDATASLLSLLDMVITDLKNDIEGSEADDATDQEQYEAEFKSIDDLFHEKEQRKIALEKMIAATQDKVSNEEGSVEDAQDDKTATQNEKKTLRSNCAWIEDSFESRRQKRRAEMDGLVEAKGVLAGASP